MGVKKIPVEVVFRVEEDGRKLAVFLDEIDNSNERILSCYSSYDGYVGAQYEYITEHTRPAKPPEYKNFLAYMKSNVIGDGYKMVVRNRMRSPKGGWK